MRGLQRVVRGVAGLPPAGVVALVLALCALVGWIDHRTGTEVRVLPLYFVATSLGAWRLGRRGAVVSAAAALVAWILAQALLPDHAWSGAVWCVNILTQGGALLFVALLVASLAGQLQRAQASNLLDALTGLRNRSGLLADGTLAVDLCRRQGSPVALAFIDIDRFKQVNDSQGHQAGDRILQVCAEVIRAGSRSTDIAARLGGDEFVITMPGLQAAAARAAMERLSQAFKAHPVVAAARVSLTIGVIAAPEAAVALEHLMAHADALMYEAKRAGRDRIVVRQLTDAPGT